MQKQLAFSLKEYKGRLNKLRQAMAKQSIDVLLTHTPENIFYLTGYHTPGYYKYQTCIVPLDSDPIMVTRGLEQPNVSMYSWIEKSIGYADTEDHVVLTKKILVDGGFDKRTIGVEKDSWFLTIRDLEQLQSLIPQAKFMDCSGTIEAIRLIKSPHEIEYIKKAARATEKAMEAGIAAVELGTTEDKIAGEVWKALVINGSTYPGLAPFICTGPRTALPHATWAGRIVRKSDVIFLEIGGCVQRYSAAMVRCGVVGETTDQVASMAEATAFALARTIEIMKPGITSEEVNNFCQEALAEAGWAGVQQHRSAYSIGISFPPDWGEGHIMSIQEDDPTILQAGMVFHVIPTIFVEGVAGISCTDTILVTEKGGEALTNFDRNLFIK